MRAMTIRISVSVKALRRLPIFGLHGTRLLRKPRIYYGS
jgi:hypothetical protein